MRSPVVYGYFNSQKCTRILRAGLSNGREWILIDEGNNIRACLMEHLQETAIVKPTYIESVEAVAQLYKTTEEILEVKPRNGKQFFLSEVQDLMGQGVIRTLRIDENLRMLYFEDALPRQMAFNGNASVRAHMAGALSEDLHGNIIFAEVAELVWGEQFQTRRWPGRG